MINPSTWYYIIIRLKMATDTCSNIIDHEIINVLIFNPDRFFSQYELYDIINKRLGDIKKNEFITAFSTIENRHKNIHRFVINKNIYLVWSTKIRSELLISIKYNKFNKHIFMTDDDYIDLINDSLGEVDTLFNPSELLNDDMNAIHLLVKKGCIKTLMKVLNLYDVDMNIKTVTGSTIFDIIYANKNMEMLEFILRYNFNKDMDDLKRLINKQKNVIRQLQFEKNKISIYYYISVASIILTAIFFIVLIIII